MSDKIEQYYRNRLNKDERDNFLWQVGKTVAGKVVSNEQVELIIAGITKGLELEKNDVVLDVGCANGMLTQKISSYVSSITGIELTPELYNVANEFNAANNISYINDNVLDFDFSGYKNRFSKVYLYEVIQHLDYQQVDILLGKLFEITESRTKIFIGGVLDAEKKWSFFDTEERRCLYFNSRLTGNDPLGHWYHKEFFSWLADKHGFDAVNVSQESELYTSHYRFDCVLHRR